MKNLLNPTTISIGFELAKDIWILLDNAIHPNHANRAVNSVKGILEKSIQQAISDHSEKNSEIQDNKPC